MADSVGFSGQVQGISSTNKSQKSLGEQKFDEVSARASDEVHISEEALIVQAEENAQKISEQLSRDESATLSSNAESLDKLL
ncbi:MAG: hypothetical protein COA45_00775 [Zetaproteobacteria bacterium]|nr:MAG: hypothetical protein COA45_00775 [Zetaproteobacteria bacterium]